MRGPRKSTHALATLTSILTGRVFPARCTTATTQQPQVPGSHSGTHSTEENIRKAAGDDYTTGIRESGDWYIEAGQGMGGTLQLEPGKQTLKDEGTCPAHKENPGLVPATEQGDSLLDACSAITVCTSTQPSEKITVAGNLVNFLTCPGIQAATGEPGKDKPGRNLFTPTAGEWNRFRLDFTNPAATKDLQQLEHSSIFPWPDGIWGSNGREIPGHLLALRVEI